MREGQGRHARGGPGPLCVGKHAMREGRGRRARGGPGQFCVEDRYARGATLRGENSAWENTLCARDKAATAGPEPFILYGKTQYARGTRPPRARRP